MLTPRLPPSLHLEGRREIAIVFERVPWRGSCHKRQKPQAPTPQAPIRNRQTRKVANAKGLNRNTNLTYTDFGVCDFSRWALTDWRLRRWRLWFLALSNAPPPLGVPITRLLRDRCSFYHASSYFLAAS